VGAHVAHRAVGAELCPLFDCRGAQCLGAVDVGVDAAHRLSVRLDERGGVELGVDHFDVQCGVSEQGGDDVDWGGGVEVFGCEGAATVVGFQHQRRPVAAARFGRRSRAAAAGLG
jgi:hypothetical protein